MQHIEYRGTCDLPKSHVPVNCHMMPIVQGDPDSLPEWCAPYRGFVRKHALERGEIGYLTVQESHVQEGKSQRGYSRLGSRRNVHVEVGWLEGLLCWGSVPTWGGNANVILDPDTRVLIANSIPDTCQIWDGQEWAHTQDGDLGEHLDRYPEASGKRMADSALWEIGILTPHECLVQSAGGFRQFVRLVGRGVTGREPYFTHNPRLA
jgi:hypothetical protein